MHKQLGLISLYTCNVWSVKCFLDNFDEKKSNKIHLSHVNASMAKKEMTDAEMLHNFIFHNVKPACVKHKKQLGQG